jgi:hypothetical protein
MVPNILLGNLFLLFPNCFHITVEEGLFLSCPEGVRVLGLGFRV